MPVVEHGDARRRAHTTSGLRRRRQRAELRRPEPDAGRDDRLPGADVASARTHVRAGRHDAFGNLHLVVMLDNILDGDDGVGALGNDAAGRDRHRLAGRERALCGPPGGDLRDDGQRPGRVGRANREAVHRRARERRQVDNRARRLGEHAPPAATSGTRLRRQRPHALEDLRQRLLDRQQRRPSARRISYSRVISVVVPVHNEERSVALLLRGAAGGARPARTSWEAVFVDDGSTDGSFAALTRLHARERQRARRPAAPQLRQGRRARGRVRAGRAGDIVVTIDGDLQDDPAEIPRLLAKLEEGFDLVSGWKTRRRDPLTRRVLSRIFNRVAGLDVGPAPARHELRAEGLPRRGRARARALRRAAPLHPGARPRPRATASRSCP